MALKILSKYVPKPLSVATVSVVFVVLLSGCAAPLIGLAVGGANVAARVDFSADGAETPIFALTSNDPIIEKRNTQTRRFVSNDRKRITDTLTKTLTSMGFSDFSYDHSLGVGIASGPKYKLMWRIFEIDRKVYMRISIQLLYGPPLRSSSFERLVSGQEKTLPPSKQTYLDFWNSLGQTAFLQNIEITPKDL